MSSPRFGLVLLLPLLLPACTGAPEPLGSEGDALVLTDRCRIEGTGHLPSGDFGAGLALGEGPGVVSGSWFHSSPAGDVLESTPDFVFCRINGSTITDVGGTAATWNGEPGFKMSIHIQDHGPFPTPTPVVGPAETQVVTASRRGHRAVDGELAIDGVVRLAVPSELAVAEGNARRAVATLELVRYGSGDTVSCQYLPENPRHPSRLVLSDCTGEAAGTEEVGAESSVDITSLSLRLESADDSCHAGLGNVVVDAELSVAPVTFILGPTDFYRMLVIDPEGNAIYEAAGSIDGGDFTVTLLEP